MDNFKRYSGVLVKHKNKVLLCKRNKKESLPNQWSIPSGKIEKNETPLDAAFREFKEETDINLPKNIDLKNGMPVTITISASAGSDLLVGELMIPIANAHESHLLFWSLVSLLIVISIAVIGWFIFRKNPIFFDQSKKLVLTLLQRIQK